MKPLITKKPEMHIVGMSFYGDPFSTRGGWDGENEIGRLWARFMKYLNENQRAIRHITKPNVACEIHIYNQDTMALGLFEVFVGVPVKQLENVPVDLLIKTLPASQYAVFTFAGEEIASDWQMKIDQWLDEVGYQRAYNFSMQYYDERFKGVDQIADSILDIYMPVGPLPSAT